MKSNLQRLSLVVLTLGLIGAAPAEASDPTGSFGPGPEAYRPRAHRGGDGGGAGELFLSFSFGEGAYFHYNCDPGYGCDTATVAPADFELLLGYRLSRNWQLDLGAVWAVDFDSYEGVTNVFGLRPGVRLLLPGLFHRIWYLRAAVPVMFGLSGENDDVLVGLLLGVGLEIRFPVIGFFGEIDFNPYFLKVGYYYVIPVQGRVGLSLHF